MLKRINNLPLFWKIFFVLLINFGFFIIVFQFFLIQQIENYYLEERKQNLKEKVIMAAQISDSIFDKYRKGLIEKKEAEKEIISMLSKLIPSKNEYYFIFDHNNRMIYHPDDKLMGKDISNLKDIKGKLIIKDIQEKLKENQEAMTDYYWQKPNSKIIAPKITYAYKIPNTNWIIASGIYLDDLKYAVLQLTKKIYFYLLVIFIVSIVVSYWLIFMITKRLKKSKIIYDKIKKGNFILEEENFYNDEFGLLQQALYKTVDYISSIFDKIIPITLKIEDHARNLSEVSRNTKDSLEVQYKNSEQISASIEETSVTIGEISKLLNETSLESTNSMEICNQTFQVSKETHQIIQKIYQLFIELSNQFLVIQEDSTNIKKVLELLNEMANQTNLISLNASIEAAKSGDKGSRFSVIAEEIRKLSMNSKESMKEISLLINKIVENINNFKNQIDHFGNDVTLAVNNFQQLNEVLKNVVQAFQNINMKVNQLASSTEELNIASKDVAKNVEMNLNETDKILKLSEETSKLASDLLNIINDLKLLTKNIKTKSLQKDN